MQQLLHSTSYLINCAENINLFYLFNEPAMIVSCWQGYVRVCQLVRESVATASRGYEQGQNPRFTPTFLQGALVNTEQRFIPQFHT